MPREAKKLTQATLKRLRREAQSDTGFSEYVADAGQPGLYAWARRGRVRFVFAYRPPQGGRRRRLKIDEFGAITLDKAREIAEDWRGLVAAGQDPQIEVREKALRALTVEQAVARYLEDLRERAEGGAKRGKRSGYASAKRRLERNVIPRLGGSGLTGVTVEQVTRLHRSMKKTPVEANRTLAALSAVYGFADRNALVPSHTNPCRHVERFEERGERRALKPDELVALGDAMRVAGDQGSIHPSALLAVQLLALTGCRRSELLGHTMKERRGEREGLRWSDVDLEGGVIELQDTKTGRQVRVIGEAVIELLKFVRPDDAKPDDPVCLGAKPGRPFVGIDKARVRLFQAADLAGREGVDLHSLRHTFASVGAHVQNGRFAAFVGPLLGHGYQKRSITERYIHSDPEALRPAADAISEAIARSLGLLGTGKVVAFQGAGA